MSDHSWIKNGARCIFTGQLSDGYRVPHGDNGTAKGVPDKKGIVRVDFHRIGTRLVPADLIAPR